MNKKWAWFGMGFFSGFIFCIILIAMLGHNASKNYNQISDEASSEVVEEKSKIVEIDVPYMDDLFLFEEPKDINTEKSFIVIQVEGKNAAVIRGKDKSGYYWGVKYLIVNNDGKYYYDDEIIEHSHGKILKQVGIYKYYDKGEFARKTIPIVMFYDK